MIMAQGAKTVTAIPSAAMLFAVGGTARQTSRTDSASRQGRRLGPAASQLRHLRESAPIRGVKRVSLLFLAGTILFFAGCNTNATRRDLFAPAKANGPYSYALKYSSYRYGVKQRKKKTTTTTTKTRATGVPKTSTSTEATPISDDVALPTSTQ
jgi:hypothetical protein